MKITYKNILSVILVSFLLLTIASHGAENVYANMQTIADSYNDAAAQYDDVGEKYEAAVKLMVAFGIMEPAESTVFGAHTLVNRENFAQCICLALGQKNGCSTGESFRDISYENEKFEYICFMAGLKLMTGDDGNFMPKNNITKAEATKVLVAALGLEEAAKQKGGYPLGYLAVASAKGITDGIDLSEPELNRQELAFMLYNCFDVKMEKTIAYGDQAVYKVEKGETFLSSGLGYIKESGIVTANSHTTLTDTLDYAPSTVCIDYKRYKTENSNYDDLLGMHVDFYYDKADSSVVKYVTADTLNQTLSVSAQDINTVSDIGVLWDFDYNASDNKTKSLKVYKDVNVIYNKNAAPNYTLADLKPEYGSLSFLDNNGDGRYDAVFVESAQHYFVKGVDPEQHTITDQYSDFCLDLSSTHTDRLVRMTLDDKQIAISSIKENDVLTVYSSKYINNNQYIEIKVKRSSIVGKITAEDFASAEGTVAVDGIEYATLTGVREHLTLGKSGTFFLDCSGRIVGYDSDEETSCQYAYLVEAKKFNPMQDTVTVKLFMPEGEFSTYDCAEYIRINDKAYKNPQALLLELEQSAERVNPNTTGVCQLVQYRLNQSQLICDLYTADTSNTEYQDKFRLSLPQSDESLTYKSYLAAFGGKIGINDDTVIFSVPMTDKTDEDSYGILHKSNYINDEKYKNLEGYDADSTRIAKVLIHYKDTVSDTIAVNETTALVSRVARVLENQEDICKIYAFKDEKQVVLPVKDGVNIGSLSAGDIIRYETDAKGRLRLLDLVWQPSNCDRDYFVQTVVMNERGYVYNRYTYGEVYSAEGDMCVIGYGSLLSSGHRENEFMFKIGSKTAVYVFDLKSKKARLGDITDLYTREKNGDSASKVFVRTYYDDSREMVIYQNVQ